MGRGPDQQVLTSPAGPRELALALGVRAGL